jgi:hypothetical protein
LLVTGRITLDQHAFGRINFRYYDFLFPSLLIVAFDSKRITGGPYFRTCLGALWILTIIFMLFCAKSFQPALELAYIVDAPELSMLDASQLLKCVVLFTSAVSIALYITRQRYYRPVALITLVFALIASQFVSVRLVSQASGYQFYRKSAEFLLAYTGDNPSRISKGVVVTHSDAEAYKLFFHLTGTPFLAIRDSNRTINAREFPEAAWIYCTNPCTILGHESLYIISTYGTIVIPRAKTPGKLYVAER